MYRSAQSSSGRSALLKGLSLRYGKIAAKVLLGSRCHWSGPVWAQVSVRALALGHLERTNKNYMPKRSCRREADAFTTSSGSSSRILKPFYYLLNVL